MNTKNFKAIVPTCAYCNKPLEDNEKTIDHIIPISAGGKTTMSNIVVCCRDCNYKKGSKNIRKFLRNRNRETCFFNYLDTMNKIMGNTGYSEMIISTVYSDENLKHVIESNIRIHRSKKETTKNKPNIHEIQNINYEIENTDFDFKISNTQAKILDYYLANPEFSDYKTLAEKLKISQKQLQAEIIKINCLTGLFILKKVSTNGIRLNKLFTEYLSVIKTELSEEVSGTDFSLQEMFG